MCKLSLVIIFGVHYISTFLLYYTDDNSDYNIHTDYIHFIDDSFTILSSMSIFLAVKIWNLAFVDVFLVILSSIVIIKWSIGILNDSGSIILDIKTSTKNENYCVRHRHHYHLTD